MPTSPIKLRFAMGHCMVLCAATLSSLGAFLFGVLASRFPLENFTKNSFHHPVMDILGCSTLPAGGFHDPLLQVEVASFQRVVSTTNLESTLKPESNPQKSPDILKTGIPNGGGGVSEILSTGFLLRLGYRLYRAHLGMLVFQA